LNVSLAVILKICKLTPFPGSDLWRLFSGTQHDLLNHLKQYNLLTEFFWGSVILDHRLTRLWTNGPTRARRARERRVVVHALYQHYVKRAL